MVWYIDQVLMKDKLLKTALEKQGLIVCKKDYAEPNFDWTSTKYAILRTTWDYLIKPLAKRFFLCKSGYSL